MYWERSSNGVKVGGGSIHRPVKRQKVPNTQEEEARAELVQLRSAWGYPAVEVEAWTCTKPCSVRLVYTWVACAARS